MLRTSVQVLLRALGVGLSAFLKTITEAGGKPPDPRSPAATEFFRTFTAKSGRVNANCLRCGGRIRGADVAWVRPDEAGPAPGFYRFLCDPCHGNVTGDVPR